MTKRYPTSLIDYLEHGAINTITNLGYLVDQDRCCKVNQNSACYFSQVIFANYLVSPVTFSKEFFRNL
jgi:hypothetical protein